MRNELGHVSVVMGMLTAKTQGRNGFAEILAVA